MAILRTLIMYVPVPLTFDDRRVKDHRTGVQTSAVEAVMDGDLDQFIKGYLMEYGASV